MPQPWAELRSPFGAQLFHINLTAMPWTTDIFWSYKSANYFWGNMKDAKKNSGSDVQPKYRQLICFVLDGTKAEDCQVQ